MRKTPGVPDDETVRYRLRLIAEEFFEMLEACGVTFAVELDLGESIKSVVRDEINHWGKHNYRTESVGLPAFIDALGDLDYVIEGARLAFGVDGAPIADAIHESNMFKVGPDGKVIKNELGKVIKPVGWTPPDIEGELLKQGWKK